MDAAELVSERLTLPETIYLEIGEMFRFNLDPSPAARGIGPWPAMMFAITLAAVLTPAASYAHGVVGDRVFLSPIVGNDAFPDNAMSVTASRSNYQFGLLPEFEKQLSDNSSILLTNEWQIVQPRAGRRKAEGFGDLYLYYRRIAITSVSHEFQLTISPFVITPTGDRRLADQGYAHLGGELLAGKGFGDLPENDWLKYLRPFALQAEAGYAGRIEGPANSDLLANLEVEYSLAYLNRFVEPIELAKPWVQLVPFVQFNYAQSLISSQLNTIPDFRLTPGVAYMGDYCELSVGVQIAVNGAAPKGDQFSALGLVEIFYDDIFPALGWNPF